MKFEEYLKAFDLIGDEREKRTQYSIFKVAEANVDAGHRDIRFGSCVFGCNSKYEELEGYLDKEIAAVFLTCEDPYYTDFDGHVIVAMI